jgi:hypothetical protein
MVYFLVPTGHFSFFIFQSEEGREGWKTSVETEHYLSSGFMDLDLSVSLTGFFLLLFPFFTPSFLN